MTFAFSETIQTKVTEYKAEVQRVKDRHSNIQAFNEQKEAELAAAKAELEDAINTLANNPNATNEKAELTARKKVAELEMQVNGAIDRVQAVAASDNSRIKEMAKEIYDLALEEAYKYNKENDRAKVDNVYEAKEAFLQAIRELGDLKREPSQALFNLTRELGQNGLYGHGPIFKEHTLFYGDSETRLGVYEGEQIRAYINGTA